MRRRTLTIAVLAALAGGVAIASPAAADTAIVTTEVPPSGETDTPAVVVNEVETNGDARGDWVELANTDQTQTADVGGWTLVDGDPSHDPIALPEGTTIESGGYLGIVTEAAFGLGGEDGVTLRDAEGEVVATLSWQAHPATTLGRCPDMTGDFTETGAGSFELPNDCDSGEEEPVDAEPWPFDDDVTAAVAADTWGEDMSGLDAAPDGTIYAVNNDNAEIFRLDGGPETYTVAESWVPSYPDGVGTPDAEGLTAAGDGAIFLSTERDNDSSGVSRPSVLRVELGADGSTTTTHEWNLTEVTGALGANAGIEAIEWISDDDATALEVLGPDGAYDPAAFGEHFGGVFVVAVEQTGGLHVLVLEADGALTELQSTAASEAVPVVMGLDWQAGGDQLWALCDEACDNRTSTFAFVDGTLTWQADHAAPVGMNPSFTNEGLAILWCEADAPVVPTVLWISDTAHDGVSLRTALGGPCDTTPADTTAPTVTIKTGDGFTVGGPDEYEMVSYKLFDAGQIDRFVLNETERDLVNNTWSDINFIEPGTFGAVEGENTLVVYDMAGNASTLTFTLGSEAAEPAKPWEQFARWLWTLLRALFPWWPWS